MPKERNVRTSPILQQELVELRMRERLAAAERHRLVAAIGVGHRAPGATGARRAVGRAVIHLGAWLGGERWEPATPLPVPVLKAVP
jgi:hypothetical protein